MRGVERLRQGAPALGERKAAGQGDRRERGDAIGHPPPSAKASQRRYPTVPSGFASQTSTQWLSGS
jgi:hypothetical protein